MMDLNVVETMYFVIGAVCAFLLAYTLTPPVRVLAFKIGAIDVPADESPTLSEETISLVFGGRHG